jgi:hypothetical protein
LSLLYICYIYIYINTYYLHISYINYTWILKININFNIKLIKLHFYQKTNLWDFIFLLTFFNIKSNDLSSTLATFYTWHVWYLCSVCAYNIATYKLFQMQCGLWCVTFVIFKSFLMLLKGFDMPKHVNV